MTLKPFERYSISIGFIFQGPLLAYMALLDWKGYLALTLLSSALGFWVNSLLKKGTSFHTMHWLMMLSFSNLGMWIGWMADFNFLPLLRDGICLCGCACSPLGLGAAFHCPWMYAGMYLAALPAMLLKNPQTNRVCSANILGCLAMGPGMMLGTYLLSHLPIQNPIFHFFLTVFVMLVGMALGMLVTEKTVHAFRKRSTVAVSSL